jgi:DNA-binding NtrC family response regulator
VSSGQFRADLFYRLSVLTIELPPLRERTGDIDLLARHFLERVGAQSQLTLSQEAADALNAYQFPGNVRELENAMTRAVALCSGGVITLDCLPPNIAAQSRFPLSANSSISLIDDRPTMEELERRYLELVLTEVGGNRRRAATVLGLNRRTIQRLIARHNLFAVAEKDTSTDDDHEVE